MPFHVLSQLPTLQPPPPLVDLKGKAKQTRQAGFHLGTPQQQTTALSLLLPLLSQCLMGEAQE